LLRPPRRLGVSAPGDQVAEERHTGVDQPEQAAGLVVRAAGECVEGTAQQLMALAGRPTEMIPESKDVFFSPSVNARVFFTRDDTGKVTGFTASGNGDFEGKRLD
jgi:hypothetical protein